jgi:hypothetical protein
VDLVAQAGDIDAKRFQNFPAGVLKIVGKCRRINGNRKEVSKKGSVSV